MSAEPANDDVAPQIFAGRYVLSRCVSERPSGEAYLGEDRSTGEPVFVKTFQTEFFANYRREAAAAFALRHPQIVGVLDTGIEAQSRLAWIAYRFAPGSSLREMLDGSPWSASDVIDCLRQLLAVLVTIHEASWIHCDIKPDNVSMETLASGERRYTLLDLGAATTTREANSGLHALGSPAYTAPERFYDGFGAQSDLYSLGVLGFELATGRLPFLGDVKEIARAHLYTEPALNEVSDASLREFLGLLLAKEPRQRLASARIGLAILSDAVVPVKTTSGSNENNPHAKTQPQPFSASTTGEWSSSIPIDEMVANDEKDKQTSPIIAQFDRPVVPIHIFIDNYRESSLCLIYDGYARHSDIQGRSIGAVKVAAHACAPCAKGGYVIQTGKRLSWLDGAGANQGESVMLDERVHAICESDGLVAVAGRGFVQLVSPERKISGFRNKTYAATTQVALMNAQWLVYSSGLANHKLMVRSLSEFASASAARELATLAGPILKLLCGRERIVCVSVGAGDGQLAIDSFSLNGECDRRLVAPILGSLCASINRFYFATDDGAITAIDEHLHTTRVATLDAAPELLAVSLDERLLASVFVGVDGAVVQTREIHAHV
jgi:serine/threonine protein kinase